MVVCVFWSLLLGIPGVLIGGPHMGTCETIAWRTSIKWPAESFDWICHKRLVRIVPLQTG